MLISSDMLWKRVVHFVAFTFMMRVPVHEELYFVRIVL